MSLLAQLKNLDLVIDDSGYESDLLEMFVHNDQATAGVTVTNVSGLRSATEVDISLLFYSCSMAGWCPDVVKCFKTFFQGGKSGWSTFILDKIKFLVASPETLHLLQYSGVRFQIRDSFLVTADCVSIRDLCSPPHPAITPVLSVRLRLRSSPSPRQIGLKYFLY